MKKNLFVQYIIPDINSNDIKLEFCGYHKCENSHSFGPAVRDTFLVHFCLSGMGVFTDKNGNHVVKKGECFIIKPNEITTYTADENQPWEYVWLAFSGKDTKYFDTDKSVYEIDYEIILELKSLITKKSTNVALFKSIIYILIYLMSGENIENFDLATKIKRYINFNYMEKLSLDNLSNIFGYERTYLYRIFKKSTNLSIKEYVTKVRMERAKYFLENGYNVTETSGLVGYNDVFNFSKAYKKYYGHSPKSL